MLKKIFYRSKNSAREKQFKASNIRVESNVHLDFRTLELGKYIFIAKNTIIGPNCKSIGSFVSIATDCVIGPNSHPLDKLSTSAVFYSYSWGLIDASNDRREFYNNQKEKVEIGNDVWLGTKVIILPGCKIGNGAVIAAGAVVTKDVEPYAIYAGVPAKLIKFRFAPEVIMALLELKWWEMPIEKAMEFYNNFSEQGLKGLKVH